jgi:uncharacterized metal-binding protein YceD (DUF177 family)
MEKTQNPWSSPVAVEEIPETGLHVEIEAPDEARAELARLAGLRELPRLSAVFDLSRRGAGVRVNGQVSALLGQTCVVTLEPIESDLEEVVDLVFTPQAADAATETETISPRADDEEPPEPLVGGKLDLGAIATEFLLLGIDPYPRKPGAEFEPVKAGDGKAKPFAALEALKKQLGNS